MELEAAERATQRHGLPRNDARAPQARPHSTAPVRWPANLRPRRRSRWRRDSTKLAPSKSAKSVARPSLTETHDYTSPVGEHLKYLVRARGQPIACFCWSSAPRHLGPRDRFIRWTLSGQQQSKTYRTRRVVSGSKSWIRSAMQRRGSEERATQGPGARPIATLHRLRSIRTFNASPTCVAYETRIY